MSKVVGLDIDDTTLELMPAWLKQHNTTFGDTLTPEQITEWGVAKFTPHGERIYETLDLAGLYDHIPAVDGALAGIRRLRESYRVVFVTANAQPTLKEKLTALVRNGLVTAQDVGKDTIVAKDKTLARVDLLIDDCAENVEQFPGPAILFDRPWNRAWKTPKNKPFPVVRVHKWLNIPSFVDVLLEHAASKAVAHMGVEGRWA